MPRINSNIKSRITKHRNKFTMQTYRPTLSEEIVARGIATIILRNEEICIKELSQSKYPSQTLYYVRKIVSDCYKCGFNSHVNPDQIFCNGWKGQECTCPSRDNDSNNNNNN